MEYQKKRSALSAKRSKAFEALKLPRCPLSRLLSCLSLWLQASSSKNASAQSPSPRLQAASSCTIHPPKRFSQSNRQRLDEAATSPNRKAKAFIAAHGAGAPC